MIEVRAPLRFLAAFTLALLVGGCASQPASDPDRDGARADAEGETTEAIAVAETAIRQAEQTEGAGGEAVELAQARSKLAEAREILDEEPERSDWLAREAAVDAELAASKARENQAREAVAQIEEDIRALQVEAAR